MSKSRVLIVVPTVSGNVSSGIAQLLMEAAELTYDPTSLYAFGFLPVVGHRPIEFARNMAVRHFLETDADWLWFLDADIYPPGSWQGILDYTATHDMVAGIVMAYDLSEERGLDLKLCAFKRGEDGVMRSTPDLIDEEVDAAGTGCLLIHRRVLEDRRLYGDPHYRSWGGAVKNLADEMDDKYWAPAIFHSIAKPNGRLVAGEDTEFCGKATALGYRLKVAPGSLWDQVEDVRLGSILRSWHARAKAAEVAV